MWKRKHKGKLGKIKFSQKKTHASNGENLDLLTDEGAFDTFRENNCTVSPKEPFYSNLTENHIEDDEYEKTLKIWEHFGIKNLGQYHDLYLRTGVLLLTDASEKF